MEDKTFINWKRDELNDIFGLQKAQKCTLLETWLDNSTMITLEEYEKQTLSFLRTMAVDMVGLWKEADLRDSFIRLPSLRLGVNVSFLNLNLTLEFELSKLNIPQGLSPKKHPP